MILINNPAREEWDEILRRPLLDTEKLFDAVRQIASQVQAGGDRAVLELEERFDHVVLECLGVTEDEMAEAEQLVSEELKQAILLAKQNIETFHAAQRHSQAKVETQAGVECWQKSVPIEKVGLYIPGGTAPLFSTVLMLAVPAKIAGCGEIVLCTPPMKDGKVHPAVLYAAHVSGVSRIYKAGGVQAIAAMAYGTESIPKVYKIFGPGNQYVMAAKQLVGLHDVAIDMPAGPSEVEVIADETANPVFVAADLISQAEHGTDSQALLVTTSERLQQEVKKKVERQLESLPRKEIAEKSLANSKLVVVSSMDEAIEMTNAYAPEHLIIQTRNYRELAGQVVNAGSVFLGRYSCESAGDYASGTNHTLPTNGYAKAYSGVNLDSFMRKLTFQELSAEGVRRIGPAIEVMAHNERLDGHKRAMSVRLSEVSSQPASGKEFSLQRLTRPNIWNLEPYSCARTEFSGKEATVFLDANENPYNNPINRYPDPLQVELKTAVSKVKGVNTENIFLGNGSDEAIDLVYRIFCEPGQDNVVAIDPSYGMYGVCADINNVAYRKVQLRDDFTFRAADLLAACDAHTKLIFVCTPNNPTGNDMPRQEILALLHDFNGLVVVDEAYGDFSEQPSLSAELGNYPNLIVLQTFSKAWGGAAIRLGMAFASKEILGLMNKVKYPYNVNLLTQQQAMEMLTKHGQQQEWVRILKKERENLMQAFRQLPCVEKVFPSDANFFLTRVTDANAIYRYLVERGIIVRNRHTVSLCGNCLRVTVGTPEENNILLDALKCYRP